MAVLNEVRTMSNHLGPLEVECDAPPYAIVRACRKLGMSEPEDVRWCRKGRSRRSQSWIQFFSPLWGHLIGREERDETLCVCGWPLPLLENYSFTFLSGEQVEYQMGQCPRCRTIYWDKV
jgi:hypothetical protein